MAEFGKLNFSVSFNPTSAFPLDARYYFDNYAAAEAAAASAVEVGLATGTYFIGEELVVVENDKATLYIIQPDKTLSPVGTAPVGDDKTIEVSEDGVIAIKGKVDSGAEQGTSYQLISDKDGNVSWAAVDSASVPALQNRINNIESVVGATEDAGLRKEVASLKTTVGDAEGGLVKEVADVKADLESNYYNKEAVDGLVAGAFHFKGSADSIDEDGDLVKDGAKITDMRAGDVYQVGDQEYAYTGIEWEELGFTIDLSNYATTAAVATAKQEAIDAAASDATAKADKALEDGKGYTDEQITSLGISDYAKTSEVESAISEAKTELQGYADQAEADAIATAGTNADSKIEAKVGEIEGTVKAYVDNKETGLTAAINEQKTRIDNLGTLAAKSEVAETDLAEALKSKIDGKADKATTLAGYGIEDAMTKTAIEDLVSPVSEKATANANKLAGLTGTVAEDIATAKQAAIDAAAGAAQSKVDELANGQVATNKSNIEKNAADIAAINDESIGILATAKKHTDDEVKKANDAITALADGAVKDNADAIAALTIEGGAVKKNADDIAALDAKVAANETAIADRYTKSEANAKIAEEIAKIDHLKRAVVEALPEVAEADANTIYMIKDGDSLTGDNYKEYMLIDGVMTLIGDTSVDLTSYVKTDDMNTALADKVDVVEGKSLVADTLIAKLENVAEGAQVNILEAVKVGGTLLEIVDKTVDIPVATDTLLGVVMSSTAMNKVSVAADGTMEVNSLNVDKLVQDAGASLVLDGGSSVQ